MKRKRSKAFTNLSFFFIENLFSKIKSVKENAIIKEGGIITNDVKLATHFITELPSDAARIKLSELYHHQLMDNQIIVHTSFIQNCIKGRMPGAEAGEGQVKLEPMLLQPMNLELSIVCAPANDDKPHTDDCNISDASTSDEDEEVKAQAVALSEPRSLISNTMLEGQNRNRLITDQLELVYQNYKAIGTDRHRIDAYRRAINAIKAIPHEIHRTHVRHLLGVGARIKEKILEIVETGALEKAKETLEDAPFLKLFQGILGVGPKLASKFYKKGYRTLKDVEMNETLTDDQKIGVMHYDDLNDKMVRREVREIGQTVYKAACKVTEGLEYFIAGSYRRGEANCNDCDVLVTHSDGSSHKDLLEKLLNVLSTQLEFKGFIVHKMGLKHSHREASELEMFLGVCRLPEPGSKCRRFDILIVPYASLGPSLVYFTGNTNLNRYLRIKADRMGMKLGNHAMYKLNPWSVMNVPTERDVFQALEEEYREPWERNL